MQYDLHIVKDKQIRSLLVWLTALSVLLAALMSGLSHSAALRSAGGSLAPICTNSGMKWLDTASGEIREQTARGDVGPTAEHCAWCTVPPVALLSQQKVAVPLFLQLAELALPAFRSITHPFAWPPSNPRAPPIAA